MISEAARKARAKLEKDAAKAGISSKAKSKYARVPCFWEGCKARFLPNGVGNKQHTTCEWGRLALKQAKAARKAA